jgi:hypothetical protein
MKTSRWLLLLALIAAGCREAPTSLRLAIGLQAGDPTPDSLYLTIFDPWGVVVDAQPLDATALPGDVVVHLSPDADLVRVLASGKAGVLPMTAVERIKIRRSAETSATILISTRPQSDRDQDGVPDPIDNCPTTANTDQLAALGGDGNVCGGAPPPDLMLANNPPSDAGNNTALDGPAPLDGGGGGAPDLLMVPATCGDGKVDPGEQCDNGASNSDDPTVAAATCSRMCRNRAPCGSLAGASGVRLDPATGHCYVGWPTLVNWATALRDCQNRAGHLVTVTTAGENVLVQQIAAAADSWLGLIVINGATQISRWITGELFSFSGYATGEPNGTAASPEGCGVTSQTRGGWDDRPCGFPATGDLPASTVRSSGFVCEHECGNGVIETGEGCDPPNGTTCTPFCQIRRACTEAGAITSLVNGHCYFTLPTAVSYATAKTSCPAGTHLATLNDPAENEAGLAAIGANEAWIALRASASPTAFAWEAASPEAFDHRRFHGFQGNEPNEGITPVCARITSTGWRDRDCAVSFLPLCERD